MNNVKGNGDGEGDRRPPPLLVIGFGRVLKVEGNGDWRTGGEKKRVVVVLAPALAGGFYTRLWPVQRPGAKWENISSSWVKRDAGGFGLRSWLNVNPFLPVEINGCTVMVNF